MTSANSNNHNSNNNNNNNATEVDSKSASPPPVNPLDVQWDQPVVIHNKNYKKRREGGKSAKWFDSRRWKVVGNVLKFDDNQTTIRKCKKIKDDYLEMTIEYPTAKMLVDGVLSLKVKYLGNSRTWLVNFEEVVDSYPNILMQFIINYSHLAEKKIVAYFEGKLIDFQFKHPLNSVCWIKSHATTTDNSDDRVVIIAQYIQKPGQVYAWVSQYACYYGVKHIDVLDKEMDGNAWTISQHLSDGRDLVDGGLGYYAENDLTLIANATSNPRYDYLLVTIFLRDHQIRELRGHCREIGYQTVGIIGNVLLAWLTPQNGNKEKKKFIPLPPAVNELELRTIFEENGYGALCSEWHRSRSLSTLEIADYTKIKAIFGREKVFKLVIGNNNTPFTLAIIKLCITYRKNVKVNNLKIEAYIHKQFQTDLE